jgi:hypothetical protein
MLSEKIKWDDVHRHCTRYTGFVWFWYLYYNIVCRLLTTLHYTRMKHTLSNRFIPCKPGLPVPCLLNGAGVSGSISTTSISHYDIQRSIVGLLFRTDWMVLANEYSFQCMLIIPFRLVQPIHVSEGGTLQLQDCMDVEYNQSPQE